MPDVNEQVATAARLQDKLLKRYEDLLDSGELTAQDASTLARLLMASGWSLDPNRLPQGIRSKLTEIVDPSEFDVYDGPDLKIAR